MYSSTIVMAIGVGGGGGNAVNHLYTYGEKEITYMLCNTDRQALDNSPIPEEFKVQLGKDGLGAGNEASSGAKFAEESIEEVKEILVKSHIRMAFVVAGMGGGTGTGASPVIAKAARELGILTIGIVTIPFEVEGIHRIEQAIAGVDELSKNVDSLIIINNSNIVEMFGDLPIRQAYYQSNEIIAKAVKSISDIINKRLLVNVDFADVCKVMRNSGVAFMGTGIAEGENRAIEATEQALTSPLLQNQDITGARSVLVCLLSSQQNETRMVDVQNVPAYIQQRTKTRNKTDLIWGVGYDDNLEDKMQVIVIVTGFTVENIPAMRAYYAGTLGEQKDNDTGENEQQQERTEEPKVIPLDGEENIAAEDTGKQTLSLDDTFEPHGPAPRRPQGVKPEEPESDDDPFIISEDTLGASADPEDQSARHVLSLDDDSDVPDTQSKDPVTTRSAVNDMSETAGDDAEDDAEESSGEGLMTKLGRFFKGVVVDNDDRH